MRLLRADVEAIRVSVWDEGVGLPVDFDLTKSKRLGARLVNALSMQLGAKLTRPAAAIGAKFTLLIPLRPATAE